MKQSTKTKAMACTMALTMAASGASMFACSGSGSSAIYNEGTYTGTAKGMKEITVTITCDANSITAVEVVGDGETAGKGGLEACQDGTYAAQIMEAQSADIDGVSGATKTSDGVREAAQAAIDQAKK